MLTKSPLTTTGISAADRKKYEKVIEKFDRFYDVRTNIIYERARFNKRNQDLGKSVEHTIGCYFLMKFYMIIDQYR